MPPISPRATPARWSEGIRPALAHAGIRIARWSELGATERTGLAGLFAARVFPVLTPLAVDPAHPFPFISNRSLNLAVRLRDPAGGEERFARIKVPPILERFVNIGQPDPSAVTLLPMEELIGGNLERLFRGMEVIGRDTFRVTRDADLAIDDDDAEDLLRTVEDGLRRARTSPAVRLEVGEGSAPETVALLGRELGLAAASVHALPEPLGLANLWELHRLDRPDLKDPPFTSAPAPALRADLQGEVEIFERLDAGAIISLTPLFWTTNVTITMEVTYLCFFFYFFIPSHHLYSETKILFPIFFSSITFACSNYIFCCGFMAAFIYYYHL